MPVMSADVCQGLVTITLHLYASGTVFFIMCVHVARSLFFQLPVFVFAGVIPKYAGLVLVGFGNF